MPRKKRPPDHHLEIASLKDVKPDDVSALKRQVADLEAKLAAATEQRSDEEKALLASLQGISSLPDQTREVATGKMVNVRRLDKYKVVGYKDDAGGREILRPVFKTVSLPTFFYKINLPPCGGMDIKINGMPLYHNSTVELDIDTLRTVKDMVFRCWAHDREIHGDSGQQFYRGTHRDFDPANRLSARMTG